MTGCGSNADKKSEEALKAEIRAEMEAEQKAKDEIKTHLKDKNENGQETVDIKDKKSVIDFVFNELNVGDSYSKEKGINELTFTYDDFNNDGNEDVVVYSKNREGFYEVAFVSVTENKYKLIDEFEVIGQYDHSITKEGNFIIYRGSGGGTGTYRKFLRIYRYVEGEILFTGTTLDIEGHDTVPKDGNPNGQSIIISSELIDRYGKDDSNEDKWSTFEYTYMEADRDDKLLLKTSNEYHYNSESNTYEVKELESKLDAKDEDKKPLISNEKYDIEQLMGVGKLEEFVIKDVSYTKKNKFSLELEGKISLKGKIKFDAMYEEYCFYSDEAFLDYPIRVGDDMSINNYIKYAYFNQKWIKELSESAQKSLKDKGVLKIACTINNIKVVGQWGSSCGTSVKFDNFEVLSDSTSELSELEKNLSRFKNEMLFSVDEEKNIDYSKYHLVIIPQQESANDNKLENEIVQVTNSGNEISSRFAVLGEVMSLEFIYYENPLVKGSVTQKVKLDGPIKDEIITVMSKMPYDQSFVKVKGLYMYQSAIEEFEFSLDSARDYESYKILTFDAQAPRGEY
jgi:hypothetical protein